LSTELKGSALPAIGHDPQLKMTVFWDIVPFSLVEIDQCFALVVEAVNTSEMSVSFYKTTQHNIPEDSHLHTRCCENLKSYMIQSYFHLLLCLPSGSFPPKDTVCIPCLPMKLT
jgi:hypothetical protein